MFLRNGEIIGLESNDSGYNRRGRTWCCAEPRAREFRSEM